MVTLFERRTWTLVLFTTVAACATSPAMRAAEGGDRVTLRDVLGKLERAGGVSNGEAASLAATVASRDLRVASGPDAALRVGEVRPCARELDRALSERTRVHDPAGARAVLARIESGRLDLGEARAMLSDPSPAWRAVGTRALVRPKDRDARAHALLDPEPEVRRQAARAARDAADPLDLDALAETARVDPEPIVRTEAVRAMAALPTIAGSRVALVLRDLWVAGDSGLREDIARAWSSPSVWATGGRDALRLVIASEDGSGAIEGSAAVLARRDAGAELANLAASQLVRSIAMGSRAMRRQALAEAPLERADLRAAVKAAAVDDDLEVRIDALARVAAHDPKAIEKLEDLGRPGARLGARARLALALAGDRRVQAWIERDLTAPAAEDRLGAVAALAALGVAARGAPLLAEEDPSVRLRAACTIVMAARVSR
jgi:HEAT repeat protein